MTTTDNEFLVEISTNYHCDICHYNTSRKYNLEIHLNSIKHKNRLLTTKNNKERMKKKNSAVSHVPRWCR